MQICKAKCANVCVCVSGGAASFRVAQVPHLTFSPAQPCSPVGLRFSQKSDNTLNVTTLQREERKIRKTGKHTKITKTIARARMLDNRARLMRAGWGFLFLFQSLYSYMYLQLTNPATTPYCMYSIHVDGFISSDQGNRRCESELYQSMLDLFEHPSSMAT